MSKYSLIVNNTTTPGSVSGGTDAGTLNGLSGDDYALAGHTHASEQHPVIYKATIGDGSATDYVVTHNFGTRDVVVSVYRLSAPWDEPIYEIRHSTINSINVEFDTPIATNSYRVVVLGAGA